MNFKKNGERKNEESPGYSTMVAKGRDEFNLGSREPMIARLNSIYYLYNS